jgi:hypothetical protein
LFSSVGVATAVFIITLSLTADEADLKSGIMMELTWAVMDTIVSIILIGIGLYTVFRLKI